MDKLKDIVIPNGVVFIKSDSLGTNTDARSLGIISHSNVDLPDELYSKFCYSVSDKSKRISSTIYGCCSLSLQTQWIDIHIPVPDGMIAIGGGVLGTEQQDGVMVLASYPDDDLSSWVVSVSDHLHAQLHTFVGYAIAISIDGISSQELLKNIVINKSKSIPGHFPSAIAALPKDYVLLGGGVNIHCCADGSHSFVTSTYPVSTSEWHVAAKDHLVENISTVTSYVIGIRKHIPNIGILSSYIANNQSDLCSHPSSRTLLPENFTLSGIGAHIDWSDCGSLLWQLEPITHNHRQGVIASAKDYDVESPSRITGYAIGIEVN